MLNETECFRAHPYQCLHVVKSFFKRNCQPTFLIRSADRNRRRDKKPRKLPHLIVKQLSFFPYELGCCIEKKIVRYTALRPPSITK